LFNILRPSLFKQDRPGAGQQCSDCDTSTNLGASTLIAVILFPVNELSMNFAPQRVDHGYLEVLIVAEALITEVPGNFSAILDCFCLCLELQTISLCGTPSFMPKKNFCIVITSVRQSGAAAFVPNVPHLEDHSRPSRPPRRDIAARRQRFCHNVSVLRLMRPSTD
jgi:hypothetical protein